LDATEVTQITTIAGAVIAAALNVFAIYQGGKVEGRIDSLVESVRGLSRRLDTLTSQQFQALLGYVRELTGGFSEKLVSMDQKVDRLLER